MNEKNICTDYYCVNCVKVAEQSESEYYKIIYLKIKII